MRPTHANLHALPGQPEVVKISWQVGPTLERDVAERVVRRRRGRGGRERSVTAQAAGVLWRGARFGARPTAQERHVQQDRRRQC